MSYQWIFKNIGKSTKQMNIDNYKLQVCNLDDDLINLYGFYYLSILLFIHRM